MLYPAAVLNFPDGANAVCIEHDLLAHVLSHADDHEIIEDGAGRRAVLQEAAAA